MATSKSPNSRRLSNSAMAKPTLKAIRRRAHLLAIARQKSLRSYKGRRNLEIDNSAAVVLETSAIATIQEIVEDHLVRLFGAAKMCARHAGREAVSVADIRAIDMVLALTGNGGLARVRVGGDH
ncbi:hypothetical protein Micbo1qcDRAFT_205139 [Microdochium bolleyi]|uniref:Core Histone H2A/H2B/H3 domain-containing protein n=1 Tax=Microdochium bolleyi TaxID=196109 RepID=A0A136J212_9PEZI|nr:hypothetical protein Micbo1qcDRAFT_205139 [Microdochium bolleyi]